MLFAVKVIAATLFIAAHVWAVYGLIDEVVNGNQN